VHGTAQVLGGNAHEGRRGNVLSGEISVAAVQKMMLQARKVKRVNLVGAQGLSYCHIKRFVWCCIAATARIVAPMMDNPFDPHSPYWAAYPDVSPAHRC
jgi:hypothetical protein